MKTNFLFWITIVFSSVVYSQTTVKGRLLEKEGLPIVGATVQLLKGGTEKHSITDDSGNFLIEVNEKGTYKVEVRFLGFKTYRSKIEVTNKNITLKDIYLEEATTQLQAVEVVGRVKKEYNSPYSSSASKISLKSREITQSVSSITKELLFDKQAFRAGDAVKDVTGVTAVSSYSHFSIRGVTQSSGMFATRLVNGMKTNSFYFNKSLSANLEKIEVIKGPSSMTFSNTDPGGSINMITKKPLKENRKSVSLTTGSFGTLRGALDFTGPLNDSKTLLYRLNIGYENSESFRDLQYKKAYLVSPSFSYIPNNKTKLNIEVVYTDDHSRLDRGQPLISKGKSDKNVDFKNSPITQSVAAVDDHYKNEYITIMGSLVHKLNDNFSFNLGYLKDIWKEDLREHRPSNAYGVDFDGNTIGTLIDIRFVTRKLQAYTDNLQAYFNTDFNLGSIKNKVVFGYDVNKFETANNIEQNDARRYLNAAEDNYIRFKKGNPSKYASTKIYGKLVPKPNVAYADLTKQYPNKGLSNTNNYIIKRSGWWKPSSYITHGAYLQNQMEWNNFIFNIGLRQEWYVDYENYKTPKEKAVTQQQLIKRFGLMYKATDNINLYGVYVDGFMPQPASKMSPEAGGPFDPLVSDMFEFGTKTQWFNGKLNTNIAFYQITQKNILVSAEIPGSDKMVQRGKERSKGFEIDIAGKLLPNWQINMGYAYLDAKILKSEAKRKLDGAIKDNAPKNSFNFWTRYNFNSNSLKNIGLGLGLNYVDERIGWYDRNLTFPSYTVLNGAIYYKIKDIQLSLNANNILNEKYWLGGVDRFKTSPGAPRNFLFGVRYDF